MIAIQAVAHYFHRVRAGEALPSLERRLRPVCREHLRRIDRFIELALLGSGECVAGKTVAPDCGLYISSGIGPVGSNVIVQDAVSRGAKLPMPFNFVNTLGSSAGYYVGKNLGLRGESVFVSRRGGSFGAALACAVADLSSGVVSRMLVGAVEECPLPVDRLRDLVELPHDAATAEGSHWLLLARGDEAGTPVTQQDLANPDFDGYESRDAALLTSYAQRNPAKRLALSFANGADVRLEVVGSR
jgi:3-oxoacyl-(acyl-carrier-protein) synthase